VPWDALVTTIRLWSSGILDMAVFELLGGILYDFLSFSKSWPVHTSKSYVYSVEDHAVLSFLGAYVVWQLYASSHVHAHVTTLLYLSFGQSCHTSLSSSSIYILLLQYNNNVLL